MRTDEQLGEIFTKRLAYPRFMMLVHRVRGYQYYDLYAVADCGSAPKLFDSDNECCSDISEVCELFRGDIDQ